MACQWRLKYQISFPLLKLSEPWKFQKSWFCISTGKTHNSKQAIYSLIPNTVTKWVISDTIAFQRTLKYQIIFLLFKVSEPWKFQMCWFFVSTGEAHGSKQVIFSLMPNWEKTVVFDTVAYQGLLKSQISFPLLKVSEPWKFQMSSFSISTGETASSTGAKHLKYFHAQQQQQNQSQEYFKHFAPARLLSEICTHCHTVAHPSVSLPSCTGMLLKMIKTYEDIIDCSQSSSGGSKFDNVGISDSLEELSLLNGE